MDKLTAIKIKYDDGTYSDEIPVSVLAENVEWDSTHTLVDVLGSIDVDVTGTIQDQISQLFNEKVNSSEVVVLKSRIDNLIKLESGSTTGDAELADIRAGADGTVYPSAGDAVRQQVGTLKEYLNALGETGYLAKKYDFIIGDVDENGNFVQGSGNMARTDKLSFDDFKKVKFASSKVYLFVCEYDSNNVYKGLIANTIKSFTLIPKEHYKYVIKVWYGASDILSKNDIKILGKTIYTYSEVDALEKETKEYLNELGGEVVRQQVDALKGDLGDLSVGNYIIRPNYHSGKIDPSSGEEVAPYNTARISEKLNFDKYESVIVGTTVSKDSGYWLYISVFEFDSTGKYIKQIANTLDKYTITPTSGHLYVLQWWYGGGDFENKLPYAKVLAKSLLNKEDKEKIYADLSQKTEVGTLKEYLNELGETGYLAKKYDFTIGDVDENGNFVQGSGNMARTDKLSFDDFKEVKFASSKVYLFVCEYDSNDVYKGLIANTVKSFTLIPKEHYKYVIKVWYGASDILSKNDIKILGKTIYTYSEVDALLGKTIDPYSEVDALEKKAKCYIDLPSKMFIEKGKSLELFKYGMFYCDKGYQPQEFNIRVLNINNYVKQYSDKIIINCPSNYSDTTLRNSWDLPLFQLLDTYGKVIDQKRVTIYVADKSKLENTTRRIAYLGDSFTGMGYRTQGIAELINNETNLSNTKLIGKFIGQGTGNRFTGTGGYSWANYTENPSSLPSSYPNNYLWDSTYNVINIKKFVENLGETQLDCVFILLGWNDYESGAFSSSFSWDTMKQRAKRLIENIHYYYPSCKIVLESYHYMYPYNRAAYGNTLPQIRHNKYIYELNKFYQSIADEYLYVEFLQMSYLIDVLHNMPMEEKTVNKRSTEKEKYCTDVVHPSDIGFYQYSDAEFATLLYLMQ